MTTGRTPEQQALHEASGEVKSNDPLVAFFYRLMRDELPVGRVDSIVVEVAGCGAASFTNGFLARHAQYLADELMGRRAGGCDCACHPGGTRGSSLAELFSIVEVERMRNGTAVHLMPVSGKPAAFTSHCWRCHDQHPGCTETA